MISYLLLATSAAGFMSSSPDVNPCKDAPLVAALPNIPCDEAKSQSPINITAGNNAGKLDGGLTEIEDFDAEKMCTVNVHWHLGAEHLSAGEYDHACSFDHPDLPKEGRRSLAEAITPGRMCCKGKELWESEDPLITTEYEWKYCKNMHVGLTYEVHWPHSNLGHCQSEWQFQHPFIDGVLCDATTGGVDPVTALKLIFEDEAVRIGVEAQVFTIVNSGDPHSAHAMETWHSLFGYNKQIAKDVATYKGSTTGDGADNKFCRGTGGLVTWEVDRECHMLEAATMDELCREMLKVPSDDLSPDVYPHGSRDVVDDKYADDVIDKK